MNTDRESRLRTPVRSQTEDQQEPIVAAGEPEAPVGPTGRPGQSHPEAGQPETSQPQPEAQSAEPAQPAELDLETLTAKAEKADEYLALAQRTKADFENYRRRAVRD